MRFKISCFFIRGGVKRLQKSIVFFDVEFSSSGSISRIGAVNEKGKKFSSPSIAHFRDFVTNADYLVGHNVIHHDLPLLRAQSNEKLNLATIDTLYLSPLLFPQKPYHALLKDEKLLSDELNNPVNDSLKSQSLFYDEINAFFDLPPFMQRIYYFLLKDFDEFKHFFVFLEFDTELTNPSWFIFRNFESKICANAKLQQLIDNHPVELAYALAIISTDDPYSITPPWVSKRYPEVAYVLRSLRSVLCESGCDYCNNNLNIHKDLKRIFGFNQFRLFNDEPLQEMATEAAVADKSLLAVFPTGGGKSLAFQLPALIMGERISGLTVVISPLVALMKDQVDNLVGKGITRAVTINGLLDPIERANSFERIIDGSASLLYIAPEMLRSKTLERVLLDRNIVRFVIDEAHCFSAWGHDFRVDYLYIGDFIRELQEKKKSKIPIPVSCFTATAKPKVISDIVDYFKKTLDQDLQVFSTAATRENLKYVVLFRETEEEKYQTLRELLKQKNCPSIVYVSRTARAEALAERLSKIGLKARAFHGQMDSREKIQNQEAFIDNTINIIVATSAFGMGVDKSDIKLVVHYDISDSLENYIQEAGRAGREPSLQAECYVLFNDNDLNKHFILLNQTKLSISEIQQVWKVIKDLTRFKNRFTSSSLEIARLAGWDEASYLADTCVRSAIGALENAGYIKRQKNVPKIYATSIQVKNQAEAAEIIEDSDLLNEGQKIQAKRIIKVLISTRSRALAQTEVAESRVDYLADILGLKFDETINIIDLLREEGLLEHNEDMSAFIYKTDTENRTLSVLDRFLKLERFLLDQCSEGNNVFNLKLLIEEAESSGLRNAKVKDVKTLLFYLTIKNLINKDERPGNPYVSVVFNQSKEEIVEKHILRAEICRFIVKELYDRANKTPQNIRGRNADKQEVYVNFSVVDLHIRFKNESSLSLINRDVRLSDMKDALLYLSKIGAMKLEDGFLVSYNGLDITRLVLDNRINYKKEDYRQLNEFYQQRIQQIHIVGEYANLIVKDYQGALQFVQDYFQKDYKKFVAEYFKGDRLEEINRNITPAQYNKFFNELSVKQREIIDDKKSQYIVVAAGPGSGKTKVLVHKLASLLLLEDIKHEQLLMLTFSRAAATEFKKRLIELVGNAAHFVEIKTFHFYCFDLLDKVGSLEGVDDVIKKATEVINQGEAEPGKVVKHVLVIDEAQDMDENDFLLVQALIGMNEQMRVIAVGDDDQNIYGFRGSDSKYFQRLVEEQGATLYEMESNYRSQSPLVEFSNAFVSSLENRMKSVPIQAVKKEKGSLKLVKHKSENFEEAIIEDFLLNSKDGTIGFLTNTNEEALKINSLLMQRGKNSKLIQSNDEFKLYNLAEIRYFLKAIDSKPKATVIDDNLWDYAKKMLAARYKNSRSLENCLNMAADFEVTYSPKYRADLEEFIKESKYEDFYTYDQEVIQVSTIHKAKGREFDSVYLYLNKYVGHNEESKRQVYVGMTRAKENLSIHYNNYLFVPISVPEADFCFDSKQYLEASEIVIQLSYRDVHLDYFKKHKATILNLYSGYRLEIKGEYLRLEEKGNRYRNIARLSKAGHDKIKNLAQKGYQPYKAEVRFIVAWQGEKDSEETAVILPDIYMRKT